MNIRDSTLIFLCFLMLVAVALFVVILNYKPNKVVEAEAFTTEQKQIPKELSLTDWHNKARADCFRLGGHTRFYGNVVFCTRKDYPLGRTNTLLFERRRHLPSGED